MSWSRMSQQTRHFFGDEAMATVCHMDAVQEQPLRLLERGGLVEVDESDAPFGADLLDISAERRIELCQKLRVMRLSDGRTVTVKILQQFLFLGGQRLVEPRCRW